ncbi:MAG: hypothetical protein JWO20_1446 [Candidatus Angelobacter sp.]|nr:hypothetical protein [Candidatus Angelobacter sp.]
MLALATSLIVALYLIAPELLFRLAFSKFLPLKSIIRTKAEELGRALFTIAIPFIIAVFLVHHVPLVKDWPLSLEDSRNQKLSDYKIFAAAIISDKALEGTKEQFLEAVPRIASRQGRFLFWFYLCTMLEGVVMGLATANYGRLKHSPYGLGRADIWVIEQFMLPKISEWQVLLTTFTLPSHQDQVHADILMSDDTLYSGRVFQHYLDLGGQLTGLIIVEPKRFDRRQYLIDKDACHDIEARKKINPKEYWRNIPSAKLYLFADKIVNLNLNYVSNKPSLDIIHRYIEQTLRRGKLRMSISTKRGIEEKA